MVQNMLPHLLSRVAYRGTEHTLPILLGILHHVWALMNQTSPLIATNATEAEKMARTWFGEIPSKLFLVSSAWLCLGPS